MSATESTKPENTSEKEKKIPLDTEREPVVTHHKLGRLEYSVTVGMLPLKDEFGETEAGLFYIAYTKKGGKDSAKRPLMFSFNGGPGSASLWLHLGALGPKRVKMQPDGNMPAPPFDLIDNPETWLEHTDLVFIDPVGTGYSRAVTPDKAKKYWSLEGDVASIGEFIRLYLSRNERWMSPLFLVGESYGTTRAAGLSGYLVDRGIAFNGIVLVSSILNFQTARFNKGNDLPYQVLLPTYTATAFYHGMLKIPTLAEALKESEEFASSDYPVALSKGDRLTPVERKRIATKLSRLTGVSADYIDQTDLRLNIHHFCKELLRSKRRTVGRLDSRFVGIDSVANTAMPEHDPAMTLLMPPYTTAINDYLGRTLGWKTDVPYFVFNPGELWKNWSYGDAGAGHPDTSEALRMALSKNPYMKVFIASGYFDLATPYWATEHTVAHLGVDASLRANIRTEYYEAGHMMYIDEKCLTKLQKEVAEFIASSIPKG